MARVPKKNKWQIVLVSQGHHIKVMYFTDTEAKVNKKFNELIRENKKNVKFPIEYSVWCHEIMKSDYELVIIKVKEDDKSEKVFRDDDNNLVSYTASEVEWVVYDRAKYLMEESFWVYGFHPRLQRKDFNWIFENLIKKNSDNKRQFKSVGIFRNKLLVENDGKLDMVICKNKDDSIRLYNELENECKKKKVKFVGFIGDVWKSSSGTYWYEKIRELTNWNKKKINRDTTRP